MSTSATVVAHQAALDAVLKTAKDNPKLARPAYIDGWSIATDGHRMFATIAPLGVHGVPEGFPVKCREWIGEEQGDGVDAEKFCRFVGEPRAVITCDDCNGDGSVACSCRACGNAHEADCDTCGGRGMIGPRNRLIRLGPALVNAFLLADVLAALKPAGTMRLHTAEKDRCALSQADWRLIFMPMQQWTEGADKAPKWEEYA